MAEHSSGVKLREGDKIKGYQINKVFDPGGFAFSSKALSPSGRTVFFKKYKRPGGNSPWLQDFNDYQLELKRRLDSSQESLAFCSAIESCFFIKKELASGTAHAAFYVTSEWVEGMTLRNFFVANSSTKDDPQWQLRVSIAKEIVKGLCSIHKVGIVHCDLKPENIIISLDSDRKLLPKPKFVGWDFPVLEGFQAPWHGQEGYVGTPTYMSPEHINGVIPNKASDVFSLGLILGELLGYRHPASSSMETYEEMIRSGSLCKINVVREINSNCALNTINSTLNKCLSPNYEDRPTLEELKQLLC